MSQLIERPISKANFPVCMAPMVGLSHVALRLAVREYMPANAVTIWPTEMLNSRRVPIENLNKTPETLRAPEETNLVPQILGNEEEPIAKSVKRLETEWGAEGIDINMGCPVKKALSHNYGVALMGDANYAAEVVKMTVANTTLPVSVKLRAGHQNDLPYLISFIQGLEKSGASWITLHPRTTEQKRRGSADWSQIKSVREAIKLPVIGNGDIQIAEDFFAMRERTSCDMVMVGRALTARPWLFWQIGEALGFEAPLSAAPGAKAPRGPIEEAAEYGKVCFRMADLCERHFGENLGLRKFRFFVKTGSPWLQWGHDLYARTTKAKNFVELKEQLANFFAREQSMSERTELRQ